MKQRAVRLRVTFLITGLLFWGLLVQYVDFAVCSVGAQVSTQNADAIAGSANKEAHTENGFVPGASRRSKNDLQWKLQSILLFVFSGFMLAVLSMNWLGLIPWGSLTPFKRFRNMQNAIWISTGTMTVPSDDSASAFKMVLVVRNDLKMGKGKIAAQCGHAVLGAFLKASKNNSPYLNPWLEDGQRKVVLKIESESELLNVFQHAKKIKLPACLISDAGATQLEPNTVTVVGIGPAPERLIDNVTRELKLL